MKKIWFAVLLLFTCTVQAVEVAPRISDREIVESLAELKAGQKAIDERFEAIERRIDDMKGETNRRFESLENLIFTILALIGAMFAYMVWDRRTALKPLEMEVRQLRQDMERDLELHHQDGSKLRRMVEAMRELAKSDPKVAAVLRSFSLL